MSSGILKRRLCLLVVIMLLLLPVAAAIADEFEVMETRPNPFENIGAAEQSQNTYTPPIEKKGVTQGDPIWNPNKPRVVKFQPGMTIRSFDSLLDSDRVELASGRTVSVKYVRNIDAAARKMRVPQKPQTVPAILRIKPQANNVRATISTPAHLAQALSLPDDATVKLPSGRLATVGQIKFMQPYIEKKSGRKLAFLQRPELSGPSISVSKKTSQADWQRIAKMPESSILETPTGDRMTLGEFKQELASYGQKQGWSIKRPSAGAKKSAPPTTLPKDQRRRSK